MKAIYGLLAIAVFVFCATALRADSPALDVKLTNGFVMRNCRIVGWASDSVTLAYVGGTVPVKFVNIEFESRKALLVELQSVQNAAHEAQQNGTQGPSYLVAHKPEPPKAEEKAAGRTEDEADAIKHAVFYHQLMVGMTVDEAIEAMGSSPSRRYGNGYILVYDHRGSGFKDPIMPELGSKDRWLEFHNGLLARWYDR